MEFLRDPAVQVVIAIVGIFVAVFIYWKERKHKSLGYEVISISPLSSLNRDVLSSIQEVGLKVMFNDQVIPQAHFITVEFTNTGNVPIRKEDYDTPISLTFGEKTKILLANWRSEPKAIPLTGKIVSDKIEINPTLLNSKDSFTVYAFVSGFDVRFKAEGRIMGVKEIKNMREGLPMSREEELINDALFFSLITFAFAIVTSAYLVAAILILILIYQFYNKIKLWITRTATS